MFIVNKVFLIVRKWKKIKKEKEPEAESNGTIGRVVGASVNLKIKI